MSRLLLIEDDATVREAAGLVLGDAGFDVTGLGDAPDTGTVPWDRYSLVVLDVRLPSNDGISLCREIRDRSNVPIVMLTAMADTESLVAGLEAGADDYVTKPFVPAELAARAQAAVRRHLPAVDGLTSLRGLTVDEAAFRAHRGDDELPLSPTELRLLIALVRHAGQVMTREQLLEDVWGYDYLGDSRLVDMAVLRLRNKLGEPDDGGPPFVATVRGKGYRFEL